MPRTLALAALLVATATVTAPATATAGATATKTATAPTTTATVVAVTDGDTLKVKDGGRVRTVHLLGVDAPTGTECGAAAATKALKRLLPKRSRVTVARDPKGPRDAAYVTRAGKLVNEALLRSGAARAGATGGLKRAARLTAAQSAASAAKRGLWGACAAPPATTQPPATAPPPPPPPHAEDPKARAKRDIQGRLFLKITTTLFSSTESRLHFCSDGSFVEDVETHSDFGPPTFGTYRGRWEIIAAEYRPDGSAGARVRRLNEDGSESYVDIVAQGGQVTVNGSVVTVSAGTVCA